MSGGQMQPDMLPQAASRAGLSARLVKKDLTELPQMLLPCILMLKDKDCCILHSIDSASDQAIITLPATGGQEALPLASLSSQFVGYAFLVKQQFRGDRNFDVHIDASAEHWLWKHIKSSAPIYRDVIIASVLINLFVLVSPLFVMNIYDKVVPNLAFESLWVLAAGASIAYIFDLILKQFRGYLIDVAGKKIDIEISAKLFSKIICIPLAKRSPSVGGMAKQLTDFDSVRDFLSSATVTALVDLPFSLLFIFCIWLVAGDLALFPVISIVLIIGYTLYTQPKLRAAIEEGNKFSSLRHGHLVECLSSLESIKANGAEGLVQKAWQQMVGHTASWLLKSKQITNGVTNFAGFVMQMAMIAVVVLGVYRVSDNDISMGGIIAAVLLCSRAISPVAKLASLMTRSHQTTSALRQLDELMKQESEFEDKAHLPNRDKLKGDIELEQVSFQYANSDATVLSNVSLSIKAGEKIAIVGRNGSGKTTLAKLLLGLFQPKQGSVRFDGLNQRQIHPSDLRANIGYLPQDIILFHGSIRDNILFGTKQVTEYQLIRAVQLSGVGVFTDHSTEGLDKQVGEGGISLSRGQRQSIALARAILNSPQILLLDEPTASLDARAEQQFISAVEATSQDQTLLLITHKMDLLRLVDRVIVLEKGQIVMDGSKQAVMAKLNGNKVQAEVKQ